MAAQPVNVRPHRAVGALCAVSALVGAAHAEPIFVALDEPIVVEYDHMTQRGASIAFNLDVNDDGVDDVGFAIRWGQRVVRVSANGPWEDAGAATPVVRADALGVVIADGPSRVDGLGDVRRFKHAGDPIGPALADSLSGTNEALLAYAYAAPFSDVVSRGGDFLNRTSARASRGSVAFAFEIDGQRHWGFVDLSVQIESATRSVLTIWGWGYEDEPETPILILRVPTPGGTALALTAILLLGLRRR